MIGTARKRKSQETDDARAKIRELFAASDEARQARADAEKRVELLTNKLNELQASLPGLRGAIKDREYDWRMAQAKLDVAEASAEEVATAEKAIDAARAALEEATGKTEATEDLISEATNKVPGLISAEDIATRKPWAAIAAQLQPGIPEAAAVLRRFFAAEQLAQPSLWFNRHVFFDIHVPLNDSAALAAELEEEFRR